MRANQRLDGEPDPAAPSIPTPAAGKMNPPAHGWDPLVQLVVLPYMEPRREMAASQFVRSGTGSGTHMRSRPPFQTSVPDLA